MKIENKSLAGVIWGLQAGVFASGTGLGLGTIAAAYVLSSELASKLPIPAMFQYAASMLVTGLIWLSIDGTMGKNFYFGASYIKVQRRKDAGLSHISTKTVRFILFFSIAQILLSTTLSTITAFVLPAVLIEAPDDTQYVDALKDQTKTYNTTISSLDKDLSDAKKSETKRIAAAKKEGHAIVQQAILSGSSQNQKLYNDGNSWFFNEKRKKYASMITYRERIEKAKLDSATLVQKERGALTSLQNAKLTALGQTPDKLLEPIAQALGHEITTAQYLKEMISGTLIYLDLVMGVLFVTFTLSLVSLKVKPSNVTAMEVVFAGISNKSAAFWSQIGKALNVDVNNIHEIEFEAQLPTPKPAAPNLQATPGQTILINNTGQDRQIYELKKVVGDLSEQNKDLSKKLSELSKEIADKNAKQLSDNDSGGKIVQENIQTVADSLLLDRTKKQYARQFTSTKAKTRDRNRIEAEKGIKELKRRGFKDSYEGQTVKFER